MIFHITYLGGREKGIRPPYFIRFARSDCAIAKAHAVEGIPRMVIGGGRIRTGYHEAGRADPASRIGLSVQQAMDTNRTVTELVA